MKKKKRRTLELKAKSLQLFVMHSKCGVSRVDLKTLSHRLQLCLDSSILLNYAITFKTLSPHNQTNVTKE